MGPGLEQFQQLPTHIWAKALLPEKSFVVQVGGGGHHFADNSADDHDPVPGLIALGWRALLLEPLPLAFDGLRARYSSSRRVSILNAAVCDSCDEQARLMWAVSLSNATGNWGSAEADGRCAQQPGVRIGSVSSLSKEYMLRQHTLVGRRPKRCSSCSKMVGRRLKPTCMREIIRRNLVSERVPCACLKRELAAEREVCPILLIAPSIALPIAAPIVAPIAPPIA